MYLPVKDLDHQVGIDYLSEVWTNVTGNTRKHTHLVLLPLLPQGKKHA